MAVCVKTAVTAHGPTLVLDQAATDLSNCQYVVSSGAELANSLFSLTAVEGGYVSAGIISCWVVAYLIRSVINVIKGSTEA